MGHLLICAPTAAQAVAGTIYAHASNLRAAWRVWDDDLDGAVRGLVATGVHLTSLVKRSQSTY